MTTRASAVLFLLSTAGLFACGPSTPSADAPGAGSAGVGSAAQSSGKGSSQVAPKPCTELDFDGCKAACGKGSPGACTLAGQSVEEDRRGEPAQKAEVIGLLQKGCDGGDRDGCRSLAYHYKTGEGVAKDPAKSDALFAKVFASAKADCSQGRAEGCMDQGNLTAEGLGTAKNEDEAKRLGQHGVEIYESACGAKDPASCAVAADAYQVGFYIAKDEAKATKLLGTGCDAKDAQSCFLSGLDLTLGTAGATKDPVAGAKLLKKACDLGSLKGCATLAEQMAKGEGVSKDGPGAVALYERACHGPGEILNAPACHDGAELRVALGEAPTSPKVLELEKRSCLLGFMNGCDAIKKAGK